MAQNREVEWYRSLDDDTEYLTEEAKIGFAVCLERQLVQHNMSKADLARRIGTSQAYITKILRGDSNLTIMTMVELASAVESSLHLHIAPRQHKVQWFEIIQGGDLRHSLRSESRKSTDEWIKFTSGEAENNVLLTA